MDSSSIGQLLSGLFSGGAGIAQLIQASTNAQGGAAAASPFGSQYGSYQPQLQSAVTGLGTQQGQVTSGINGIASQVAGLSGGASGNINNNASALNQPISSVQGMNPNAGTVSSAISGSGGQLVSDVNSLASNYMANPAIQSEYQLGLNSVNAGLAAQGLSSSGAADIQLEQYGQDFAANAYQQQLSDILNTSQTAFSQNVGSTQLGAALQGQTFGQGIQQQSLISQLLGEQAGLYGQGEQAALSPLSTAGGLLGTSGNLGLSSQQNLISQLLAASGATTGSPGTAGAILSNEFSNTNTALGNLGAGIGGAAGSLLGTNGALSGLSGMIQSLLGSGGNTGNTGGSLGNILNSLGSSATGGDLSGILSQFSGAGDVSNVFGNSVTDLGTLTNNVLGDAGATLGGLDAGTSVGSDLAASFL